MNEVKGCLWQLIREQVVAAHLDPIAGETLEQAGVNIHREHRARVADPLSEHPHDRASTSAHIQTAPTLADTDRVQLTGSQRIVVLLQQEQSSPLEIGRVLA